MCSQKILLSFLNAPVILVANRAIPTLFMNLFNFLKIFFWEIFTIDGVLQEESVMKISCWVTLRLEKCIKVPEWALNKSVSWHFIETHFQKNLSEERSHLQKWVQVTSLTFMASCFEIEVFEPFSSPTLSSDHFFSQVSFELLSNWLEVISLSNFIVLNRLNCQKLSLL